MICHCCHATIIIALSPERCCYVSVSYNLRHTIIIIHSSSSHCPHVAVVILLLLHRRHNLRIAIMLSCHHRYSAFVVPSYHSFYVILSSLCWGRHDAIHAHLGKQVPLQSGRILKYAAYSQSIEIIRIATTRVK